MSPYYHISIIEIKFKGTNNSDTKLTSKIIMHIQRVLLSGGILGVRLEIPRKM